MSKNISIAEGGTSRQFTNDKLKINLVGGGTEYYVPESSVQLGTKSVTANGTYTAASDGKYGFSQFSVNVRGAAGSADSSGKPTTSGGTAPGGVGSAVVGTDPETGNDVAVGVDEDGNLVQTPVPSGIKIVTLPTKSYIAGETMDYSGLVVKMVNRDGTTFTDANHPNGYLSMSELVFPVTVAPSTERQKYQKDGVVCIKINCNEQRNGDYEGGAYYCSEYLVHYAATYASGGYEAYTWIGRMTAGDLFITRYQGYFYAAAPETVGGRKYSSRNPDGSNAGGYGGGNYGTAGVFYNRYNSYWASDVLDYMDVPESAVNPETVTFENPETIGGTADIPVQWVSPYTGDTYEDSFNISVTANNSSGGSGGGGSF